ncbi:hypothetical protein [Streptomyces fradiae]|uniref:hypothetical protein n=1 Tax=Streptomyces fradiae TaxID=1906 RepID=UPI002941FF7D|nr:hypothetical protein [Streptomyces fradiae]WOI61403.1 hypothetical protein RYQ63_16680 [Streptomyces fradiae]
MPHVEPTHLAEIALGNGGSSCDDAEALRHVAGCGRCQEELRRLARVVAAARAVEERDLPAAPPERVWRGVVRGLAAQKAASATGGAAPRTDGTAPEAHGAVSAAGGPESAAAPESATAPAPPSVRHPPHRAPTPPIPPPALGAPAARRRGALAALGLLASALVVWWYGQRTAGSTGRADPARTGTPAPRGRAQRWRPPARAVTAGGAPARPPGRRRRSRWWHRGC